MLETFIDLVNAAALLYFIIPRLHRELSRGKGANPLDVPILLKRQITDWQNLMNRLEATNAWSDQVAYCKAHVERLKEELSKWKA